MNDFYDVGVHDDKFVLLSKMNVECKVCVKTLVGVTDQLILKNIEMQGTVPAPLKCAAQMDGLGWECYTEKKFLYNYKRSCFIPNLGMIDDTFLASSCGVQSVQLNALINTLVEGKRLYFNQTKCYVMHLGPNSKECPKLMVHNLPMKKTTKEKYLGNIVSNSGNNPNIENRRKIGFKAISDILPMLKEDGSTSFYILCGLIFRDAVLKCKLLLNSEVWHGLTVNQVNKLEDIDKTFLRIILNSHAKV